MSRGGGFVAAALLTGSTYLGWMSETPEPTVIKVNDDDSLLSRWPSEDLDAPIGAPPECAFWNSTIIYARTLCSHFTISRAAAAPARARQRALACAGAHGAECILSPEVGLAIPAAFLYEGKDHDGMTTIIAPRLVPFESEQRHVRVAPPDGDGMTDTHTFVLNSTVEVEYMDGDSRSLQKRVFDGEASFCVQLLRLAFEEACWAALD
jgi:hypothetical protein